MTDQTDQDRRKLREVRANARDEEFRKGNKDLAQQVDADELRQRMLKISRGMLDHRSSAKDGSNLLNLDAVCMAGNLPSEYLRALAVRAREKAISPKSAWLDMALKLEAWADE